MCNIQIIILIFLYNKVWWWWRSRWLIFSDCSCLIGSTGIINHVIIIPMLLDYSGRDSWISIIVLSLVYIIWIPFVFIIHKQTSEEHLFAWLIRNYGGFITYPLLSILILYLIMLGIVTLKETLTFFSFYLPETPRILLGMVLTIICFYNIQRGIQSIALTTGILLPVVFMLGFCNDRKLST